MRKTKNRRKFVIIAKVDNYVFVKYRSNNVENFIYKFLLVKWPGARFANIYSGKGQDKGSLLFTWGKIKGLQSAGTPAQLATA